MSKLLMATAAGEQHGLINTLTNSVPFDDYKNMKPEHKKEVEAQKKKDSKMVTVEYMNKRGRHERLTKPYCRYQGDPIQIYHFIPGYTYTIPKGLVDEVNDKNKRLKHLSGCVSLDGEALRKDEAPIEKDMDGDWIHRFINADIA